jgi:hypothetical protein
MNLRPIVELGVDEAYQIVDARGGVASDLPPLAAIENEDWGRDFLLAKLWDWTDAELAAAGLTRTDRENDDLTTDSFIDR